jgi:hypothetical protein
VAEARLKAEIEVFTSDPVCRLRNGTATSPAGASPTQVPASGNACSRLAPRFAHIGFRRMGPAFLTAWVVCGNVANTLKKHHNLDSHHHFRL